MREGLEFTEKEKLEQLCRMIVAGKMEQDDPWKEFKELLSSLPVELVNTTSVEAKGSSEEKRTLLQVAAAHDNKGAVRLLLEKGVNPKETGSYGKTAINIATANESMDVVELLWEAIGEEIPDEVKLQQLSKAMYKEDTEEAKKKFSELLRSLSPDLVSTTAVNRYGSVLQDAVLEGKIDFVRLLLEYGVDAKVATDEKKDTPIKIALERDRTEIAFLLSEAIGEEVPDKMKLEQLSKAMYKENKVEAKKEFSKILASLSPDMVSSTAVNRYGSVLRDAVLEGKTDFIGLLLKHGVDPTIGTDSVKESPIQLAAQNNSVEIMTLFTEYAKNPASMRAKLLKLIIESDGQQDASLDAFKQQLESLSASEVDQIYVSGDGNLLHFAVIKDLKEHVRILLEHGCDPKVPIAAYDDKSPLETAIDYGRMEIWNMMREGLEFTEKEKLEQLCRMIVAGKMEQDDPWKEFKELLSSLPVDLVNTTSVQAKGSSEEKRTLLQVAAAHDNKGAVRLLLEKGVDPKETGSYGKTAMKIAIENESMEVVELLWKAIGEEIPDKVKLQQLSKAMYKEDIEEAKKKFSELLRSLSPDLVSTTAVNRYGSVLQDAVLEGKTDFVRLLLDYGVDAKVATKEKEDTPIKIALERDRTEIAFLLCEAIGEEVP